MHDGHSVCREDPMMKTHGSGARSIGRMAVTISLSIGLLLGADTSLTAFVTSVAPYAVSIDSQYETFPLLSVGDRVPETSDPTKEYQMIGIPDGLGAHPNPDGTVTIFMN